VFSQKENWLSGTNDNYKITIRKLPSVEYTTHDHEISTRVLPLWVSLDASASLLHRQQDGLQDDGVTELKYQTRQFLPRADFAPRIMTALSWKEFHLVPYFQGSRNLLRAVTNVSYDALGRRMFKSSAPRCCGAVAS